MNCPLKRKAILQNLALDLIDIIPMIFMILIVTHQEPANFINRVLRRPGHDQSTVRFQLPANKLDPRRQVIQMFQNLCRIDHIQRSIRDRIEAG